jgi:entericidin B
MRAIKFAILALTALTLVGCNTAEGIGKDVQAGGKAIEKSATKVKKKL